MREEGAKRWDRRTIDIAERCDEADAIAEVLTHGIFGKERQVQAHQILDAHYNEMLVFE